MSKVKVEKPTQEQLKQMKVSSWPIWEKEVSCFDWSYDETEVCFLLDGQVLVKTEDGEEIEFKSGDLVTFEKGLSCTWDIKKAIRKHYNSY